MGFRNDLPLGFPCKISLLSSAPGRIRTCDPRIRSPLLCPAELRAQSIKVLHTGISRASDTTSN